MPLIPGVRAGARTIVPVPGAVRHGRGWCNAVRSMDRNRAMVSGGTGAHLDATWCTDATPACT
jgi:hypothetical protein